MTCDSENSVDDILRTKVQTRVFKKVEEGPERMSKFMIVMLIIMW